MLFEKKGQKLCGIYDADRIKVLPQKPKWYKLVPAAMLLTGLVACSKEITNNYTLGKSIKEPSTISKSEAVREDTDLLVGIIAIEVNPTFPGGEAGFKNYIHTHLKYNGTYKGKIFVSFVVETDGSLSEIKTLKGGEPTLNNQIIDIIEKSPHWMPKIQNGKKYRSAYTLPISF